MTTTLRTLLTGTRDWMMGEDVLVLGSVRHDDAGCGTRCGEDCVETGRYPPITLEQVHMVAADDGDGDLFPPFPGKFVVEFDRLEDRVDVGVLGIDQGERGRRMEACLPAHDGAIDPGFKPEIVIAIDTEDERPLFCHSIEHRLRSIK